MFDIEEFRGGGVTRRCFVIRLGQGSVLQDLIGSFSARLHGRALSADHLPGLPGSPGFAWGKEVFIIGLTVATDGVFYQIGQAQNRLAYTIEGRTAFIDQFGLRVTR